MTNLMEPPKTVFRAFERAEFVEWPSWERLQRALASNGGSYGLSGPRGAGKSWLMLRAIDDARFSKEAPGIGLWYPSPSEYDPLAFLASLSDSLVNEIERRYTVGSLADSISRYATLISIFAGLLLGYFVSRTAAGWQDWLRGGAIAVTGAIGARIMFQALEWTRPGGRLRREALRVRERARYSATTRESAELGASAGRGVVGSFKSARERELVDRPATLSGLVNDFRSLAEHAAREVGRVVVAIDELDKMDDPHKVRALLRDIKGIFEVPNVHFLVSVSDEAARSLNLGALTGRTEFNSSFYTVIELPPISPEASAHLLETRAGVNRDVAMALGVLAGGNPREVIRLAELVGDTADAAEAILRALKEEALNLRREIVTFQDQEGRPPVGPEARVGAFRALPDDDFEHAPGLLSLGQRALDQELWEPQWSDAGWGMLFGEPWRRLLIRLAVGSRLLEEGTYDEERLLQLRDVMTTASQSAAVARILFEERLRVETRVTA